MVGTASWPWPVLVCLCLDLCALAPLALTMISFKHRCLLRSWVFIQAVLCSSHGIYCFISSVHVKHSFRWAGSLSKATSVPSSQARRGFACSFILPEVLSASQRPRTPESPVPNTSPRLPCTSAVVPQCLLWDSYCLPCFHSKLKIYAKKKKCFFSPKCSQNWLF